MEKYVVKKFEAKNSLFSIQGHFAAGEGINSKLKEKLVSDSGEFYKDGFIYWFANEKNYEKIRGWMIEKIRKNNNWGDRFYKNTLEGINKLIFSCNKQMNNVEELPLSRIAKGTRKFVEEASSAVSLAYLTDYYAYRADEWIRDFVGKDKLTAGEFRILSASDKLGFGKEYEYELAKIKLADSKKSLKQVVNEYFWAQDNYQILNVITEEKASNDLDAMKEEEAKDILDFVEKHLPGVKQEKEEVLKRINVSKFEKKVITLLSDFVDLQDKRKAAVLVTNNIASAAYKKVLKAKGIEDANTVELILQSAFPFWITDCSAGELIEKSTSASNGCLQEVDKKFIFWPEAEARFNQVVGMADKNQKEIKGYAAFLGKITGRVKIINKVADFSKLEQDEILVTSMTRPEMVPIMKIASAFITDEGGITCHAAIIAREMRKPCIIGTKIATQVLKDGDMVEVDANKGIVKIIK